jgi:hypothetical protein
VKYIVHVYINTLVDIEMNDLSKLPVDKVLNSNLCSRWYTDRWEALIVDVEMNDLSNLPVDKVLNSDWWIIWCTDHLKFTIILG